MRRLDDDDDDEGERSTSLRVGGGSASAWMLLRGDNGREDRVGLPSTGSDADPVRSSLVVGDTLATVVLEWCSCGTAWVAWDIYIHGLLLLDRACP